MKRRQQAHPDKHRSPRLPKIGETAQPSRQAPTPPVYVKSSECKRKRGMVVETDEILKLTEETWINVATEKVYRKINEYWMREVVETVEDEIQSFYIGSSFIDKIPRKGEDFSLDKRGIWKTVCALATAYTRVRATA